MVPNQNSSIVPNQTTHHRKLPSSQGSHVRSLAQEETPKNIVEKFFGFHDSFSVYGFHVVGASPHAVRTVCNLCSIRQSLIRQVAFPKSFSCLRIKRKRQVRRTSKIFGWKELSSITSTPYMALDLSDFISGCTRAAASNTWRITCFTFSWISIHLTIKSRIVLFDRNKRTKTYIYVEEGNTNTVCTVMFLFKLSHKLCCGLVIQLPSIVLEHIRKWETWVVVI